MDKSVIELCVRRASDLATLRRIEDALRTLGLEAELSIAPGVAVLDRLGLATSRGPCALRVIVESGTGELEDSLRDGSPLAVIWDDCVPPMLRARSQLPVAGYAGTCIVAVPGEAHARYLSLRFSAEVVATGLPRFDFVREDMDAARREARRRLGLPDRTAVIVYAPSASELDGAVPRIGDAICELCGPDRTVLIWARDWPDAWLDAHRHLAAARAGLLLSESDDPSLAIVSADLVIADPSSPLWEAYALGIRTLSIDAGHGSLPFDARLPDAGELAASVGRLLSARDRAAAFDLDALRADGGAAARIAEAIRDQLGTGSAAPSDRGAKPSEVFARLEARAAFGEGDAASKELRSYLAFYPSAEGYALLASIERRGGRLESAVSAAERAVQLGCEGAARALCERASGCRAERAGTRPRAVRSSGAALARAGGLLDRPGIARPA